MFFYKSIYVPMRPAFPAKYLAGQARIYILAYPRILVKALPSHPVCNIHHYLASNAICMPVVNNVLYCLTAFSTPLCIAK